MGAKGILYWSCPIQIPSKCWGWSNLVFTQEIEVQPEPELVEWRKVEVKKDNRIVETLTKFWDPQQRSSNVKVP